jgi:triosephosphate isomerase (TIM)
MRDRVVAANWKMNLCRPDGLALVDAILGQLSHLKGVHVILGVPFPFLGDLAERTAGVSHVHLAAQNCHQEEKGAYTGEVSAAMLKSFGVEYVILGHSERREFFGEDDALILKKMRAAVAHGIRPIYCCGERQEQREAGRHFEVVGQQLNESVLQLQPAELNGLIIAYEPVWAIGTGLTASPEQAEEMHRFIHDRLQARFGSAAEDIPLLYGGSVKPSNADELFSQPHIDGGLIGGASLVAEDFLAIVKA